MGAWETKGAFQCGGLSAVQVLRERGHQQGQDRPLQDPVSSLRGDCWPSEEVFCREWCRQRLGEGETPMVSWKKCEKSEDELKSLLDLVKRLLGFEGPFLVKWRLGVESSE